VWCVPLSLTDYNQKLFVWFVHFYLLISSNSIPLAL
jgi:hypothetical protein